jgi:membrane-associated progesterone receptor component
MGTSHHNVITCLLCLQIEPLQEMTADILATFDGMVPDRPIYLAIKGKVYDVSAGRMFYGPAGAYPFAGKECARALALMSTDLKDCTDDLEGLGFSEKDTLKDWIDKFDFKYPVVGTLVPAKSES